MELTAPAKVNLFLEIISKRDDGYHELGTIFEKVSLVDIISIELSEREYIITCDDPRVPVDENSLLGKTVSEFNKASGTENNFLIHVEKRIPIGAGLGGGSSDAGSLLRGMNKITGNLLSVETLREIAGKLGADVPLFVEDCSFASGRGRGDIVKSLPVETDLWHVLVNPPFEVSTKEIFGKVPPLALTKKKRLDTILPAFLGNMAYEDIVNNLHNDLQDITIRSFPEIRKVFDQLQEQGARGVLLSGSGPTVFGIFSREDAEKAGEKLSDIFGEQDGWSIFVVNTYLGKPREEVHEKRSAGR